jgi:hypothetical protein
MHNRTISDLEPNDKVRKLTKQTFTKGTEPKWSDEVYEVKQVRGQTIKLDDDTLHQRHKLLKVPKDTESTDINVVTATSKQ